nr:MAG TPA: hypothetical protein [Caudoviricetes sp.]
MLGLVQYLYIVIAGLMYCYVDIPVSPIHLVNATTRGV